MDNNNNEIDTANNDAKQVSEHIDEQGMQEDEKVLGKTETKNDAESHNKKTSRQKRQIRDLFTSFSFSA